VPIYEYQCEDCDQQFEEWFRTRRQVSEIACPRCGSQRVMKMLSVFGVQAHPSRTCPYEATS